VIYYVKPASFKPIFSSSSPDEQYSTFISAKTSQQHCLHSSCNIFPKKNKKMLLDDIYISFVYKTYKIFLQLEYMFGVCYNFATSVQYFYCL